MVTQISNLPNGLRIVTDQMDHVETAALGMWVAVGARYEDESINGISHFLEHMAFKGTVNMNALQIAEHIEQVGGYMNACTTREATAYYMRVLARDIPLALDLLSDILQFSVYREDELERERKVILQEISEANDTPDDLVFDLFQATAFPRQPLGRSILGSVDVIRNLSRESLLEYQRKTYSASHMVLAAAGKVNHEEISRIAQEKFIHLERDSSPVMLPARYQGGVHVLEKDLEQVHLILGFKSPSLVDSRYYDSAVLAALLGGGMSSRLFQKVREQLGLAYSIYAFKSAFSDAGTLGIYAGTSPDDVERLLPVLKAETENLASTLEDKEIARAKAQLKSHLLMGLEKTSARCEQLANHMLIYGRPLALAELVDRIEAVTRDDLVECAELVFSSRPALAAVGPVPDLNLIRDFQASFPDIS